MKKIIFLSAIFAVAFALYSCGVNEPRDAEKKYITADTVYFFKPGEGQHLGQDSLYFPKNVFGPPSKNASETIPETSPAEILSLGLGGEIILGFKNYEIIDEEGDDFAIFENVFLNLATKKYFIEPAIVSVSENGENFFDFPYDSVSLRGLAGLTPTFGQALSIEKMGGDRFDLAKLGLKRVRYIKIKDYCSKLKNDSTNPNYDPSVSGFDLDAVIGINYEKISR